MILCVIYWAVPKGHLPWRGVWPGALFMTVAAGLANILFPAYLVNLSTIGEFGRIVSFVLVALIWFYVLALGLLAGAVINALRFELHDTGKVRGMTADFPAPDTATGNPPERGATPRGRLGPRRKRGLASCPRAPRSACCPTRPAARPVPPARCGPSRRPSSTFQPSSSSRSGDPSTSNAWRAPTGPTSNGSRSAC